MGFSGILRTLTSSRFYRPLGQARSPTSRCSLGASACLLRCRGVRSLQAVLRKITNLILNRVWSMWIQKAHLCRECLLWVALTKPCLDIWRNRSLILTCGCWRGSILPTSTSCGKMIDIRRLSWTLSKWWSCGMVTRRLNYDRPRIRLRWVQSLRCKDTLRLRLYRRMYR